MKEISLTKFYRFLISEHLSIYLVSIFTFLLPLVYSGGITHSFFLPKWGLVYLTVACLGLVFILSRLKINTVRPPRFVLYSILIMLAFYTFNSIKVYNSFITNSGIDRAVFLFGIFLVISVLSTTKKAPKVFFISILMSVFVTCIWAFIQAYNSNFLFVFEKNRGVGIGGMGNVNMAAQFVGSTLFLTVALISIVRLRILKVLLSVQLLTAIIYLVFALNRSVFLSLAVGFIFFLFFCRKRFYASISTSKLIKVVILLMVTTIPILFLFLVNSKNRDLVLGKDQSTSQRVIMQKAAMKLFLDKPLGIGSGQYNFANIPYSKELGRAIREGIIDNSPHNEYLRFLVEDGILFFIGIINLLAFLLFLKPAEEFESAWHRHGWVVAKSTLVFFMTEALFQFPLENPWPFFYSILLVGYLLNYSKLPRIQFNRKIVVFLLIPLTIVVGLQSMSWWVAGYAKTDKKWLKRTCEWIPSNWSNCILYSQVLRKEGDLVQSTEILEELLNRSRHNYFALRAWGVNQMKIDPAKGCAAFWVYDQYFDSGSRVSKVLDRYCEKGMLLDYSNRSLSVRYREKGLRVLKEVSEEVKL